MKPCLGLLPITNHYAGPAGAPLPLLHRQSHLQRTGWLVAAKSDPLENNTRMQKPSFHMPVLYAPVGFDTRPLLRPTHFFHSRRQKHRTQIGAQQPLFSRLGQRVIKNVSTRAPDNLYSFVPQGPPRPECGQAVSSAIAGVRFRLRGRVLHVTVYPTPREIHPRVGGARCLPRSA